MEGRTNKATNTSDGGRLTPPSGRGHDSSEVKVEDSNEKTQKNWLKIALFSLAALVLLSGAAYAGYWYGVQGRLASINKTSFLTTI